MRRSVMVILVMSLLALSFGTATAQDPEASPGPEPQRVEVPEAGIALSFPADWSVVVQMVRDEAELPAELNASESVDLWLVLQAGLADGGGCELAMYGEHPMALDAHAEWIKLNYEAPDTTASATTTPVELPIGEAVRFDITETEGAWTAYLFEAQGTRYQLRCGDGVRHEDDWLTVAGTIEAIDFEPLDLSGPDEISADGDVDVVLDFDTVVSVVAPYTPDFPMASLMNADCAFALWIRPRMDRLGSGWLAR